MNFEKELDNYLNSHKQVTVRELRELRQVLFRALQSLDKKLDSITKKVHERTDRCPYCNSSNTKGYGQNPNRSYCLDCKHAYVKVRSPLYYRKRNRMKILDLIVAIHTTQKSTSEIIKELNVSVQTYYKWKKEVISVFPQLEEEFVRRGKK